MGEAIYGYPVGKSSHPTEWQTAKTFFLALVYGARWTKLLDLDPRMTRKDAMAGHRKLTERYRALPRFVDKVALEIRKNGYARDWFGRVRWFPGAFSARKDQRESALREAVNFKIQGPAASVTKIGMVRLADGIKAQGLAGGQGG
jgi:DNA polymerase-1